MTNQSDAKRLAFEVWAKSEGCDCCLWISHAPSAGYANSRTQDYWTGWRARAAPDAPQPAMPDKELSQDQRKLNGLTLAVWACAKPNAGATPEQMRDLLAQCVPYLRAASPIAQPASQADAMLTEIGEICREQTLFVGSYAEIVKQAFDRLAVQPASQAVMQQALDFGDYVIIEQKRFGVPNEFFTHKVIGCFESNSWIDVPAKPHLGEVLHDTSEPVVSVICCGVCEDKVVSYRVADVKRVKSARFAQAVQPADHIADAGKMVQPAEPRGQFSLDFAKAKAAEWHGQAGGEPVPQLTVNELAGILNEVAGGTAMQPLTDEQFKVLNFLIGHSHIDGVWFGEKHPNKGGSFWWRSVLQAAFPDYETRFYNNIKPKEAQP